jgi:hypothetical protein
MTEKENKKMNYTLTAPTTRRHLYLTCDIETANHTEDALAYDLGLAIIDRYGNVYARFSLVIMEIFEGEADLMQSAYYAEKIPEYYEGIANGEREVVSLYEAYKLVKDLCETFKVKAILAYNAFFDVSGMNRTQRYVTKSKYRWFFPYGIPVHCIWHMACQTICSQKKYYDFCIDHGFVSASGNISTSAETVYRFITDNPDFEEEHKGLEDVEIEAQIFAECIKKHKAMNRAINRGCWRIPQRKVGAK